MDISPHTVATAVDKLPAWVNTLSMIVATASAVAAITPTPRDEKWIAKFYRIIDLLALNIGHAKSRGDGF